MAESHRKIRRPRIRNEPAVTALIVAIFALLLVFVLAPLASVLKSSLTTEAGLGLSVYRELLSSSVNLRPLLNSVVLGASVALVGTTVGYTFAYILTLTSAPLKRFFRLVATFPMISPPFIIALAAIMLLGHNGVLTRHVLVPLWGESARPEIYGFWGLLLVETISYAPTAFLLMVGVFSAMDPALEEAAENMGASPFRIFRDVVFPLSIAGIFSSFLLIFIESLADFGNPLILSGNFRVLSVEAYLKITGEYDLPQGAALAIMLLVPSLIAFFIQKYYVDKKSFVTLTGKPASARRRPSSPAKNAGFFAVCAGLSSIVFLLYGTVIYGSFMKTWGAGTVWTLRNYVFAIENAWRYVVDTLLLASIAAPLTGIFGMLIAYLVARKRFRGRAVMETVSMLTFAVPGTVVGIGYILTFNERPLMLTGTGAIIVLLFIFRNAPVGIRSGIAAIKQVDPAIEEASVNLGASSMITFRKILLPLITPAFFSGLAYAFVRCMTAISAVIFVVSGKWNLLTIAILGFVENSDLSAASAMCMMLIVFVMCVLGMLQFALGRVGAPQWR